MKLNDILKKIGNFGTSTKIIVREKSNVLAIESNLQSTEDFKNGSFEHLKGINAKEYKVESFIVSNHTLTFYVSPCKKMKDGRD